MHSTQDIRPGTAVYDVDERLIGTVERVGPAGIEVDGLEYSREAIARVLPDGIYLAFAGALMRYQDERDAAPAGEAPVAAAQLQ